MFCPAPPCSTRAVQKLVETLGGPEQVDLLVNALRVGVVALIKDLNGNHVVQRCLQRLSNEDSQVGTDINSRGLGGRGAGCGLRVVGCWGGKHLGRKYQVSNVCFSGSV